jgi:hypothetical protein
LKQELVKKVWRLKDKFVYLIIINHKQRKMKKVFLALALVATVMVSCKKTETVETTTETEVVDTTAVETPEAVDTTSVTE